MTVLSFPSAKVILFFRKRLILYMKIAEESPQLRMFNSLRDLTRLTFLLTYLKINDYGFY